MLPVFSLMYEARFPMLVVWVLAAPFDERLFWWIPLPVIGFEPTGASFFCLVSRPLLLPMISLIPLDFLLLALLACWHVPEGNTLEY
jgi:hypothetical protein